MAVDNNITSAVGTSRQFSKQPEATYQRRLNIPNFNAGQQGASLDGEALKSAFGILGNALQNEGIAKDNREQRYVKYVEDLAQANPEGLATLGFNEFMRKHSKFSEADNPYTRAAFEKAVGRYYRDATEQAFQLESASMPLETTMAERMQRRADFFNKEYAKNVQGRGSVSAFKAGFFENTIDSMNKEAHKYVAEKTSDIETKSYTMALAEADKIANDSLMLSDDEVLDRSKKLVASVVSTVRSTEKRNVILQYLSNNTASISGRSTLIEKLKGLKYLPQFDKDGSPLYETELKDGKESIVTDSEGKPVPKMNTLGDVLTFSPLNAVAAVRSGMMHTQEVQAWDKQAEACTTVEGFYELLEKTKPNRSLYEYGVKQAATVIANIKNNTKVAATALITAQQTLADDANSWDNFRTNMDAYVDGRVKDGYGATTNKFFYRQMLKTGELSTTPQPQSQAMVERNLQRYIHQIDTDTALSREEQLAKRVKILSHQGCKFYAKTYSHNAEAAMSTLEPSSLKLGSDGKYVLPEAIDAMIGMRRAGGSAFLVAFGDEDTTNVDALLTLQTSMGFNEGVNIYANNRENFKDRDIMTDARYRAKKCDVNFNDFKDIDGNNVNATDIISDSFRSKMKEQMAILLASGAFKDDTAAAEAMMKGIRDNLVVCADVVIPTEVMTSHDKHTYQRALQFIKQDYSASNDNVGGITRAYWDIPTSTLVILGGSQGRKTYTKNDIDFVYNEYIKQATSVPEGADSSVQAGDTSTATNKIPDALNKPISESVSEFIDKWKTAGINLNTPISQIGGALSE